jgi:hypothetical protein
MDGHPERWFHYTLGVSLLAIIASRTIKRGGAGTLKGERRAVWLTRRTDWETTASPGIWNPATKVSEGAPIARFVKVFGPLIRLEVPATVAAKTWTDHLREGGIDLRTADTLVSCALEMGSDPADWRLSYHDIPTSECVVVEWSNDGETWLTLGRFNREHFETVDADALQRCGDAARALQSAK